MPRPAPPVAPAASDGAAAPAEALSARRRCGGRPRGAAGEGGSGSLDALISGSPRAADAAGLAHRGKPCRPRHFRPPPPCAPVVTDERACGCDRDLPQPNGSAAARVRARVPGRRRCACRDAAAPGRQGRSACRVGFGRRPARRRRRRAPISSTATAAAGDNADTPVALCRPAPDPRRRARRPGRSPRYCRRSTQAEVYAKLSSGKSFVWIRRRLTPRQQYRGQPARHPRPAIQHEERRVYPFGDLASHVVGFCGIDNNGLAGIERALDRP